jgi:predicted nuclease of restriction endonuclease-like (RecB) superfamily
MLRKGAVAAPEDAITAEQEIKDPYVLEFLALKDEYSESDLLFFQRRLRCLIIVDLKRARGAHSVPMKPNVRLRSSWAVRTRGLPSRSGRPI